METNLQYSDLKKLYILVTIKDFQSSIRYHFSFRDI